MVQPLIQVVLEVRMGDLIRLRERLVDLELLIRILALQGETNIPKYELTLDFG